MLNKLVMSIILIINLNSILLGQSNIEISDINCNLKKSIINKNVNGIHYLISILEKSDSVLKNNILTSQEVFKNVITLMDTIYHSEELEVFYMIYPDLRKQFISYSEYIQMLEENFSENFSKNVNHSLNSLNKISSEFFKKELLSSILFAEENIMTIIDSLDSSKLRNKEIIEFFLEEHKLFCN